MKGRRKDGIILGREGKKDGNRIMTTKERKKNVGRSKKEGMGRL